LNYLKRSNFQLHSHLVSSFWPLNTCLKPLQVRVFSTTSIKRADPNTAFLVGVTTIIPGGISSFLCISIGLSCIFLGCWIIPIRDVISVIHFTDTQVEQASQFTAQVSTYQGFINEQNINLGVGLLSLYWEFITNYIQLLDINLENWSPEALRTFLDHLWLLHILHEALYEGLQAFNGFMDSIGFDITNNTELNLDFRNVGNTILRIVRRIENILDIPIQDSKIIRHWYEF
jgi:hypothetical protein